jgi:hypothetical protein
MYIIIFFFAVGLKVRYTKTVTEIGSLQTEITETTEASQLIEVIIYS